MDRRKLLTTPEAAEILGIDRRTLANYARNGLLRPAFVLPTGHLRWDLDDLMRQMREIRRQRTGIGDGDEDE